MKNIFVPTQSFWKLAIICAVCLEMNVMRLYHFLPIIIIIAFIVSLADEEKLFRGSSLSILMTASWTTGLEFGLVVVVSGWCSWKSVSVFQNLNTDFPLLSAEAIQFHQNLEGKNVRSSPVTSETSILSFRTCVWGGSIMFDSESLWDHKPALVI